MALRIEDYALIGDCKTAALVGKNGSIDWLCWPNFSSGACLAALLGGPENGYWSIAPVAAYKSKRRYREHTLILETTFHSRHGVVRLTDFMPMSQTGSHIVRIVEGVEGAVPMRMQLSLRHDYGRTIPWVTATKDGIRAVSGPLLTRLRSSESVYGEAMTSVSEFTLSPGECKWFTLSQQLSHLADPPKIDPQKSLTRTEKFWTGWTAQSPSRGRYAAAIERSLITLKALIYQPTGGIVAAPTTSLPESIGGPRNWDYRYCWLRDTTFTLLALMSAGYYDEAEAWQQWLLRSLAGSPDQVQIMYGLAGERELVEWEADWLRGYESSPPVRIGNAAAGQLQLDIYGEVLDAFYHSAAGLGKMRKEDFPLWRALVEHLGRIWQQPDQGIWEVRGGPQHFTYSKVMAWVAFDRAIQLAEHYRLDAPLTAWRRTREQIHTEVCQKAWDAKKNSFVQSYESRVLDAALLLIPLVGFLPVDDPRIVGTVEAIERELMQEGLLLRYNTQGGKDGLPPGEGAFLACSFWLVSALHAIGRKSDARKLFERLLRLSNDVGLLAEEYDPRHKRQLGNFPQALSHISLLIAALHLEGDSMCELRHGWHSKKGAPTLAEHLAKVNQDKRPKSGKGTPKKLKR